MKAIFKSVMVLVAAISLTACSDVPMPYEMPGTHEEEETTPSVDPVGTGVKEDPYNVSAALQLVSGLASGAETETEIYVKGKVKAFDAKHEDGIANFGNGTYTITDDGSNEILIFQSYYLGGEKFTSADQLKIGDEVIICGKFTNYKGNTPETVGKGSSYIYSLNGQVKEKGGSSTGGSTEVVGEPKGTGTQADPFNVAGIVKYTSALAADANSAEKVYFKGIVSQTKDISAQYGNATFYISDNGKKEGEFYVFRCLGLNGEAIKAATDVQVGDEVVVYGNVVNYKGNTPETVQKEAYLVSVKHNGTSTGGDTGATTTGEGVSIDGTNVTLTNAAATAGTETITVDLAQQGWENQTAVDGTTLTLTDGTTITFAKGDGKTGPSFYTATKGIRFYANNTISFAGKATIAKVVFACDSYNGTDYVGNTTATFTSTGKNSVYTNAVASGSGVQLRVKTITITYAK